MTVLAVLLMQFNIFEQNKRKINFRNSRLLS